MFSVWLSSFPVVLLALIDPEVHVMAHCFPFLPPAQFWYRAGLAAVCLIIWSFLYTWFSLFCLKAQRFIFLLSTEILFEYICVGHPSCQHFDFPLSQFVIHEGSLSPRYCVDIIHGFCFAIWVFFVHSYERIGENSKTTSPVSFSNM